MSRYHVVGAMHERKAMMSGLADTFFVGPGDLGTLEEAFETLPGIQLGYHRKPIVFLDVDGFWARLEQFPDHAVDVAVLHPQVREQFRTAFTPAAALDMLAAQAASTAL